MSGWTAATRVHHPTPTRTVQTHRDLAQLGYQIPENPDQLTTRSLGDSIRSMQLNISCMDVTGGTCGDLIK